MEKHNLHLCVRPTTFSTTRKHYHLFRLQCILLCYVSFRVHPFGRLCQDKEHDARQWDRKTVMISQVLLFFCFFVFRLFPETSCTVMSIPRLVTLHVIVIVARSGTSTAQASCMGEIWYLQKKMWFIFFFFLNILHIALCCTVLWINNRLRMRLHCTSPDESHSYCTAEGSGPPDLQCRPEPLHVAVMDQFYKHVLSHFYLLIWFPFYFGKRFKKCSHRTVKV